MLQGRSIEINRLNDFFSRSESSIVILYGEQLSGISSLVREFAEGKNTTYLSCVPASNKEQTYLWARNLKMREDSSLSEIFEGIISSGNEHSLSKKLLVISDFQLAYDADEAFRRELFAFVEKFRYQNRVTVLLTCSDCDRVLNHISKELSEEGKKANYIKVNPLKYIDLVCLNDNNSFDELLNLYALIGGYQDAYEFFDADLALKRLIIRNFLEPNGMFRHYGIDLIKTVLREPACYASILASLAEGRNKLNDLYLHTGFSRAKISVYLKNLINLCIVEKVQSFDTPGEENTKKGMYRIANPMVKFYFTYVYPNESFLANMHEEVFYNRFIAPSVNEYCMDVFPQVCEEFLCLMNERDMLPIHFTKYGEWVGKIGTVDIIAQDADRNFLFGFCKRGAGKYSLAEYEDAMKCVKETHLRADYVFLFSLDGFEDEILDLAENDESIYLVDRTDF